MSVNMMFCLGTHIGILLGASQHIMLMIKVISVIECWVIKFNWSHEQRQNKTELKLPNLVMFDIDID